MAHYKGCKIHVNVLDFNEIKGLKVIICGNSCSFCIFGTFLLKHHVVTKCLSQKTAGEFLQSLPDQQYHPPLCSALPEIIDKTMEIFLEKMVLNYL